MGIQLEKWEYNLKMGIQFGNGNTIWKWNTIGKWEYNLEMGIQFENGNTIWK